MLYTKMNCSKTDFFTVKKNIIYIIFIGKINFYVIYKNVLEKLFFSLCHLVNNWFIYYIVHIYRIKFLLENLYYFPIDNIYSIQLHIITIYFTATPNCRCRSFSGYYYLINTRMQKGVILTPLDFYFVVKL